MPGLGLICPAIITTLSISWLRHFSQAFSNHSISDETHGKFASLDITAGHPLWMSVLSV